VKFVKELNDLEIQQPVDKGLRDSLEALTSAELSPIDILEELRANLKQAQYLQAKLGFMTQEVKGCLIKKL